MSHINAVCGIIAEYNPFHNGHKYHIAETRALLGADTAIICVMSGNVVQRGEFALLPKHMRAEAAVKNGADLVFELPARASLRSAEGFAKAGVELLSAAGIVTHLSFGCECGGAEELRRAALLVESDSFQADVKARLKSGVSYPAACEASALAMDPNAGEHSLLRGPNNILGVEYMKALLSENSPITALGITRTGAGHDGEAVSEGFASASALRKMLTDSGDISPYVPDTQELERCFAAGHAPALLDGRVFLSALRRLSLEDFRSLRDVTEGLENRLFRASRQAVTADGFFTLVKTKRYTMSRVRRIAMRAYLGLYGEDMPLKYLRVLAFNEAGKKLLHRIKRTASLPIITKTAAYKDLLAEEISVTAQFALCLPKPLPAGYELTRSIHTLNCTESRAET